MQTNDQLVKKAFSRRRLPALRVHNPADLNLLLIAHRQIGEPNTAQILLRSNVRDELRNQTCLAKLREFNHRFCNLSDNTSDSLPETDLVSLIGGQCNLVGKVKSLHQPQEYRM